MNVRQVYGKYFIPKNLQEHMLRVSALSKIILEGWTGSEAGSEIIVKTCALHDIGKPVTFDIAKQAGYGMPASDIANLTKLQEFVKSQYGKTETEAVIGMCKDIGFSEEGIRIIENMERHWRIIPGLFEAGDINTLISIYCDMRIGPKGILPLVERLEDLKNRVGPEDYEDNVKNGKRLELLIKKSSKADLNSITEKDLEDLFPELLELEI
jgi:hypothetical protein